MKSNIFWNRGNKTVKLNPILSSATCEKSTDSIGSVTLTIDRERIKDFDFQIGDTIIVPYFNDSSKYLFRGKVFKLNYTNTDQLEIVAYDILKYLQGKKYNVFPTIDLGSIIKVICADLDISYGYLEKTPNCPAKLFTDKSYGDILSEYQSYFLYMNGKKFIHRVENDTIALRDLQNLMTNYLITDSIVTNYTYTESAEDSSNVVEITRKNSDSSYTRYVTGDKSSIDKLGVLVMTLEADEDDSWEKMIQKANNQLFMSTQYKYDLSFTIPELALLNVFDIIKTKISNQPNMGYISSITWNLIDDTTEISLSLLGK